MKIPKKLTQTLRFLSDPRLAQRVAVGAEALAWARVAIFAMRQLRGVIERARSNVPDMRGGSPDHADAGVPGVSGPVDADPAPAEASDIPFAAPTVPKPEPYCDDPTCAGCMEARRVARETERKARARPN